MKISTLFVPTLASTLLTPLTLGISISALTVSLSSLILSQPATAQSTERVQPLEDFNNQQNEPDSFSGNIGGSGLSVFDLIHQYQRGVSSYDETTVKKNLDNATEEFRRQQLEQLNNQQLQPTNPSPTPQTVN